MTLSNADWYEWVWIGVGLLWGAMTLWGSITAWQDVRWVLKHPDADAEVQAELLDRTRTDRRYELSSLLGAITITYFGTRALLLPPNPFAREIWGQVGALLAVAYALVKTATSVQNRLTRRRFDRRLARHKKPQGATRRIRPMNDSTPKLWYQSRTIWLSIGGILTAFAIAFLEVVVRAGDDVTWATIAAAALAGFGALNIYLRWGTHQALTTRPPPARDDDPPPTGGDRI